MRILIDTNLLARHSQPDHALSSVAEQAFAGLFSEGHSLFIVPQVLYEYWSVATRPGGEYGLGLSTDDVRGRIDAYRRLFVLLRDERSIYPVWQALVHTYRVQGKPSHDTRLVAAMIRHGLTHLLTFNASDFARYSEISTIRPQSIAS
jgi:predicted nucleic acid-binding protein